MTNKAIREIQRVNSKKLDENGLPLIRQHRFPKPINPISGRYQSNKEKERRKHQIANGQLKKENGLVA